MIRETNLLPDLKCLYLAAFILSLVVMARTKTWYTWHTPRQETHTQWNIVMIIMKRTQGEHKAADFKL